MKTSESKDFLELDEVCDLPKYKLYGQLPETEMQVCLYIIEDKKNKVREIKTLLDGYNLTFNQKVYDLISKKKNKKKKQIKEKSDYKIRMKNERTTIYNYIL